MYMAKEGVGASEMARRLGVSHSAVIRWRDRQRVPRPTVMLKIAQVTGGAVTANDFMGWPEPAGAADRGVP